MNDRLFFIVLLILAIAVGVAVWQFRSLAWGADMQASHHGHDERAGKCERTVNPYDEAAIERRIANARRPSDTWSSLAQPSGQVCQHGATR
jgi:hypothetical protein